MGPSRCLCPSSGAHCSPCSSSLVSFQCRALRRSAGRGWGECGRLYAPFLWAAQGSSSHTLPQKDCNDDNGPLGVGDVLSPYPFLKSALVSSSMLNRTRHRQDRTKKRTKPKTQTGHKGEKRQLASLGIELNLGRFNTPPQLGFSLSRL